MNAYDALEAFAKPWRDEDRPPLTVEEKALLEKLMRQIPITIEKQRRLG